MASAPASAPRLHCRECSRPLADDQRYCLRCGARRGPLPARIGLTIGEIHESGRALPSSGAELGTSSASPTTATALARTAVAGTAPSGGPDNLIPAARSAAVAILLMIAFGSVIGSLTTPGGVTSLARALVVAFAPVKAPVAIASLPGNRGGGSGRGGGGGGGGRGTSGTPAASSPSSRAPAASAAPPVVQQTVTVGTTPTQTTPTTPTTSSTPSTGILGLPPIKHVWEIVLSSQGYNQAWATSTGHPYLARTLRRQGELITDYYGVAGSPLANEIALISGQGPTPQTLENCPTFTNIAPATTGRYAQVKGTGCVYPPSALTLPDQLTKAGLRWRAYLQGIGRTPAPATAAQITTVTPTTTSPSPTTTTMSTPPTTTTSTTTTSTTSTTTTSPPPTTSTTTTSPPPTTTTVTPTTTSAPIASSCPHPPPAGADDHQTASAAEDYVTWRNPFVYFRSVLIGGHCAGGDVGLWRMAADLAQANRTPAFSYISPGPCDDGSDLPCRPGAVTGLAQSDTFLKKIVPEIEHSAAYKQGGLIAITFDQAPHTGPHADLSSCCDQPTFPNLPRTSSSSTTSGTTTTPAPSGTTVAAPGATTTTPGTTTTTPGTTTTAPGTTTPPCSTSSSPTTPTTTPATITTPTTTTTTTTTSSDCPPASALPPGTVAGGGKVGLLLISRYVRPNSLDQVDTFNHFSLLKTIEDFFGLKPLGYARDSALPVLDGAIFNANKH